MNRHITKEAILAAKQANLASILQNLGVEIVPNRNGYHLRDHDSLKFFQKNGVWLYKWWSRGGEVGDGIQYLRRHMGMGFVEAVETLSGSQIHNSPSQQPPSYQWRTKKWQTASKNLINLAVSYLLGPNGKECFFYLIEQRGLYPRTILKHRLGFLPKKDNMPSKLLIPCYDSKGNLTRIRFRIDKPEKSGQRYRLKKGSNPFSPLALGISNGKPLVIVESELDAILIYQEAGDLTGVLSIGTTGNKLTTPIIKYLNQKIPLLMISLDNDASGKMATQKLLYELPKAVVLSIPEAHGKDPGEAWKTMNIRAWIKRRLEKSKQEQFTSL